MKKKRMGYLVLAKRAWGEYYLIDFEFDELVLNYFKNTTDCSGTRYPHKCYYIDCDDGYLDRIKSHLLNNGWVINWEHYQLINKNLKQWLKQGYIQYD